MTEKRSWRRVLTSGMPVASLLLLLAFCALCTDNATAAADSLVRASDAASVEMPGAETPLTATTTLAYLPLIADTQIRARAEWSAEWWQWIEDVGESVLWEDGAVDCSRGQSGDVWHIAGTAGAPPVTRSCAISVGKVLFVPILTVAWSNEGAEDLTVEEKRAVLADVFSVTEPGILNSKLCGVTSEVDGASVPNVRLLSPPFLRLGDPESVSDGYWFAFKPTAGAHEIVFTGSLCAFDTDEPMIEIDVTYNITVE